MARTPKVVEDRREQIIDAAVQIFSEKGFERATNKDVAQAAGITPGLIYHYFASKEDLLKAIFEEHSPLRLMRLLPENVPDLPPETMLRWVAHQILSIVESEQYVRLARIFLAEVLYNPEVASIGFSAMAEVSGFLERYLAAKMESGEIRSADPSLVLQLFGGSLMAMVIRRQFMQDPLALQYTHEQIVDGAITMVLHGLLPT
jgi:TetR/AcrR family transcriptional regulator, cholesterol catabolism regulator